MWGFARVVFFGRKWERPLIQLFKACGQSIGSMQRKQQFTINTDIVLSVSIYPRTSRISLIGAIYDVRIRFGTGLARRAIYPGVDVKLVLLLNDVGYWDVLPEVQPLSLYDPPFRSRHPE